MGVKDVGASEVIRRFAASGAADTNMHPKRFAHSQQQWDHCDEQQHLIDYSPLAHGKTF
jgi:hypothetical protein